MRHCASPLGPLSLVLLVCSTGTVAQVQPTAQISPIDPDRPAKAFQRGLFTSATEDTAADGKVTRASESVCMDDASAAILTMGILMGTAGCEPQSTSDQPQSIAVTALCTRDSKHGPNLYQASMRWSADGKTITARSTRTALVDGKPSGRLVVSHAYELRHQAASCP